MKNRSCEGVGIRELNLINPQAHVWCAMGSEEKLSVLVVVVGRLFDRT